MNTVTIRANATEGVNPNTGEGYPVNVRFQGGKFLSGSAALEIAQEAVDTIYGEYASGYLATINYSEWEQYKANSKPVFYFPVVKL